MKILFAYRLEQMVLHRLSWRYLSPLRVTRQYNHSHPRHRSLTNSLVMNIIVKSNLPVSLVDDEDFRSLLLNLTLNSYPHADRLLHQ